MKFVFSLAQYTQLCRLIVPLSLNVASSDRTVTYLGRPHLVRGQVSEYKTSIFELAKFDEH